VGENQRNFMSLNYIYHIDKEKIIIYDQDKGDNMKKSIKSELFTAISVFLLGFTCGMLFVLRYTDSKSFEEKYHKKELTQHRTPW
jgi:hypothetical protein